MLSYRHAFHAGSPADVFKHLVLAQIFQGLQRKPAAMCYIDTHAGAGAYDLQSREAEKVGEFRQGIARVWQRHDVPDSLHAYLDAIRAMNAALPGELRYYPGSPALARHWLRPQDRMVLIERHPSDHARLSENFALEPHCRVELGDGFELLRAFVPPLEKRGVVLIDPSYELKTDYRDVIDSLAAAYQRWATGVYVLWYPLIARDQADRLQKRVIATGIRRVLGIEFALSAPVAARGLWGSGLIVVNPPYQLDAQITHLLPWLHRALQATPAASCGARWLVPE